MLNGHGAQCQQLLNIAKDSFLEQVVTEPTRVTERSSNILDLFFTNNETLVIPVHIVPGIADHEGVFLESSLRPIKAKAAPRKVYQYKKADYEGFKSELREYATEFQYISNSEDIDNLIRCGPSSRVKYMNLWRNISPKSSSVETKSISHGLTNMSRHCREREINSSRDSEQPTVPKISPTTDR